MSSSLRGPPTTDFAQARRNMVDNQLRTFDVSDRAVLAAMGLVPRELFMPAGRAELAYLDGNVDFSREAGERRVMLPPMVLARLLQALEIGAGEKVLDVASGLGYASAVLAMLGAEPVALETSEVLAEAARSRLARVEGGGRVLVRTGPLAAGCPNLAPFDAILVNGAVETRPDGLIAQLAPAGRLACLRRAAGGACRAVLMVRAGEAVGERALFDAAAPTLRDYERPPAFQF